MAIQPFNASIYAVIPSLLAITVVISAIMLINLIIYIVVFHILSSRADQRYKTNYQLWLETWANAYFTQTPPAQVTVSLASAIALQDLSTTLPSDDIQILIHWAKEYRITNFWESRLHSTQLYNQIQALEALAILGDENHLSKIFKFAYDDLPVRRASAILAIATLIPRLPNEIQQMTIKQLADAILSQEFPVIVIEGVYAQLGKDIDTLIDLVLEYETITFSMLRATIYTISRFFLANHIDTLGLYITHPNPTIRVSTLAAFANLKSIPVTAHGYVMNAIHDPDKSVREQAVKTMGIIPLYHSRLPLWLALGDDDWDVRFTAGQALYQDYGEKGRQILHTASKKHQTQAGRHIATEMLKIDVA